MKKYLNRLLLCSLSLFVWIPLWMVISGALMPSDEVRNYFGPVLLEMEGFATWPLVAKYPTLQPIVELLFDSPEFFRMFWNSVKLVLPILFGQIVLATPAAWGFSKFNFPLKKTLFMAYIAMMLMPFQVTMVSSYLVIDQLGLMNTRWSVILPAICSTFPVFILYRFFGAVPKEMLEAAKVDGAGDFKIFLHIGLPLGKPGVISIIVLGFLEYWNMIEQPLTFIQNKSLWPLSLYLPLITADRLGLSIAAAVIMLIPALLVFLWGQSYLEAGIQAAGIKG